MSVLVLLEAPVKSEEVPNMKSYLAEILPDSRKYDGCRGLNVYFDTEDKNKLVLVEHCPARRGRRISPGAPSLCAARSRSAR